MKKKINTSGIVYSTNPEYTFDDDTHQEDETLQSAMQNLLVKIETKHRAGKTVTLIEGFVGTSQDKEDLVKKLKNHCGTGGSAKDGEMLVQGDHRDKILQWLIKNGFARTRKK